MAAAGLWTTASDLARLGVELLRVLRGDGSVLGLDRSAVGEMLRPQLPDKEIGQEFRGLGWRCSGRGDAFQFGHRGANEGYSSSIVLNPARGQGAVVLLNSNQGFPLIEEILQAIGRHCSWPSQAERKIAPMPSGVEFAGEYRDLNGFTFDVIQADREILLRFGDQPALPLRPRSNLEFFADALNLHAQFQTGEDGEVFSMTLIHGGKVIDTRKESGRQPS
jgi:CubicO group peptidase (beta-lactamase class C family)